MLRFPQQLLHHSTCNINHSIPKCFRDSGKEGGGGQITVLGGQERYSLVFLYLNSPHTKYCVNKYCTINISTPNYLTVDNLGKIY